MFVFVVLVICISFAEDVEALFIRPPTMKKPYPALKLATADLLRIPYRSVAYDAGEAASLPSFALSLNAEFGPLDVITFLGLQEMYGGWSETKSRVKWIEGGSYTLLDFLPPLMQAVNGLYFKSSRQKQMALPSFLGGPKDKVEKRKEQEVLLTTNCWGFAWEALYQADNKDIQNMQISAADPLSAYRAFTNPKNFYRVQTSYSNSKLLADSALRNKKLKKGDTLLIWHQIPGQSVYLDHVAILLDDDVYYEKSGSGDQVPFRITTWEGITANFPPGVFTWEWRRLVRNKTILDSADKQGYKLKSAAETFGVDKQVKRGFLSERFKVLSELRPNIAKSLSLQTEIDEEGGVAANLYTGIYVLEDLVFDKRTGRASLPMSAFSLMFPLLPSNPYVRKQPARTYLDK